MSISALAHLLMHVDRVAQRRQLLDVVAAAKLGDRGGIWLASSLAQQGGELVEVVLMAGWRRLEKDASGLGRGVGERVRATGRDEEQRARAAAQVPLAARRLPAVPIL